MQTRMLNSGKMVKNGSVATPLPLPPEEKGAGEEEEKGEDGEEEGWR